MPTKMRTRIQRRTIARLAAAGAVAGIVGAAAPAAFAATATTPAPTSTSGADGSRLVTIKQKANMEITNRVNDLTTVISVLDKTSYMGSDQALLVGRAQTDISELQALDTKIQGDTTVASASADAATIFSGFRVYALVLPVDHLVRASDAMTNVAIPALTGLESKWSGSSNPQVQALVADMKTQTTNAATALNGVVARLEGYTPAEWNANHALLAGDRGDVGTARTDLGAARKDAKQIREILKGSSASSTTGQ